MGILRCVGMLGAVVLYLLRVTDSHAMPPGETFRDCAECPLMVVVPAGDFLMGSPPGEEGHDEDESPQRRVTIARPFAIGVFEVTFDEWDDCIVDGGCGDSPRDKGWGRGRHPVINLSFDDARSFTTWLSAKTGRTYRLPSEAEWEYAARAGSTTRYHFGDSEADLCKYANGADLSAPYDYHNVACDDGVGARTAEVGSYAANAFGLHDVLGNVWEWVRDCWSQDYAEAPVDGSAYTKADCRYRVARGGSWLNEARLLRSAYRDRNRATVQGSYFGFRVLREIEP